MNKKLILKIYLLGVFILVGAILINIFLNYLNIESWHGFLKDYSERGVETFKELRVIDFIFMFLVYPSLLGVVCYYCWKVLT